MKATHVQVRLTVDLIVPSSYGPNATIAEVRRHAVESARTALMRGLVIDGLTVNAGQKTGAIIVGKPEMGIVIAEDA